MTRQEKVAVRDRQLAEWKTILLPEVYERVVEDTKALQQFYDDMLDDEIARGDCITGIVRNLAMNGYRAKEQAK